MTRTGFIKPVSTPSNYFRLAFLYGVLGRGIIIFFVHKLLSVRSADHGLCDFGEGKKFYKFQALSSPHKATRGSEDPSTPPKISSE